MSRFNSQTSRIFLVGVCRNVEKSIFYELENLTKVFGESFYKAFIVESDSADETVRELRRFSIGKSNFHFESLGNLSNKLSNRTSRIAHCRNFYMQFLDDEAKDEDLVVIADLDGANLDLTKSSFNKIWEKSDWDVCTANQRFAYFDIWALRAKGWSELDWMEEYNQLIDRGVRSRNALRIALYAKMKRIGEDSDWIPVDSSFGGLGVYRFGVIRGLRYTGELNGREICEHVTFHKSVRERGGRIFIVPGLINCNYSSHTEILKLSVRLKTSIIRNLRRIISSI